MAIEEQHVALPQLYGAPAYARPLRIVPPSPRPFDPDDLPIVAIQTNEERELAEAMPGRLYAPAGTHRGPDEHSDDAEPTLRPRPLSLRALAGRILGQIEN
ncbi:MAG TPA: hypothetical protein VFY18_00540 [Candidatus Limnocylindrales bacterium]|nr:hypothetical protein [Candidatus Limnocylindrales bacterium]